MSLYTTGELARLCEVSVRTVQYYDNRNILTPSALSEGGRRLYSENDVRRLRVICFLRDIGLSINDIGKLLAEDSSEQVIELLLEQQEKSLSDERKRLEEQLRKLQYLRQQLRGIDRFSVETVSDIAVMMIEKQKLRNLRITTLLVGIFADMVEWGALVYGFCTGVWWPFAVGMILVVLPLCVWISLHYYQRTAYICPQCHNVFRPRFKEVFWARHTPKTRKLTCPSCGHKGFCVEVYHEEARQ